jgi:hypothetical protein
MNNIQPLMEYGSSNRWLRLWRPGKVQVVPVGTQFNEYALWVFEPRGEPSGVLKPRNTMNHGEKIEKQQKKKDSIYIL